MSNSNRRARLPLQVRRTVQVKILQIDISSKHIHCLSKLANHSTRKSSFLVRFFQRWVRNFVFFGVTYMTLYHAYTHLHQFYTVGNTMKSFGFMSGVI